ncbi:MAG: VanW family protein [Anaerotignum sp.]|nr:VanW family protein [Anaerotignum sp.]
MEQGKNRPREQQKEQKKNGRTAVIAVVVVIAAVAGFLGYNHIQKGKIQELLSAEGIYQGVTIGGTDVAGLSEAEALKLLQDKYKTEISGQVLTLYYDGEVEPAEGEEAEELKWEIPFAEIGAGYQVEDAVKVAYDTGRVGSEEENYKIGKVLLTSGMDIEVPYTYDEKLMDEKLAAIAEEFDREAEDSTVTRQNGKFVITDEKDGLVMDKAKTLEAVAAVMETRMSGEVLIVAEVTKPDVTAEDNENVTDLIGTFYTTFNNSDRNRNTNLAVGCNYINGTILAPGEVFSANVELGSQTAAGGYKMAGVYNNGKTELGMAGGVCQVTTTLYNAALMAELEIVERHPHSMTVGYVPLGRDAAVAGTYKDLKFRNNTEYPIMIEAYAANGKLVMNIFGHEVHNAGRKVSFDTVYEATVPKPAEIVTEDPERPEGEREITSKGRTGCKVSVYKTVTDGGKTSREWFSSSSYRAVADEVTVGTKKVEVPAVAPVDPFAGITVIPAEPDVTTDVVVEENFGIQ